MTMISLRFGEIHADCCCWVTGYVRDDARTISIFWLWILESKIERASSAAYTYMSYALIGAYVYRDLFSYISGKVSEPQLRSQVPQCPPTSRHHLWLKNSSFRPANDYTSSRSQLRPASAKPMPQVLPVSITHCGFPAVGRRPRPHHQLPPPSIEPRHSSITKQGNTSQRRISSAMSKPRRSRSGWSSDSKW